jgi:hypothetical protein
VLDDRVVCVLDPKEQEGGHRKPDPNDYIRQGNNRVRPRNTGLIATRVFFERKDLACSNSG